MGDYDQEKAFVMDIIKEVGDLQIDYFGQFLPPSLKDIYSDSGALGNPESKSVVSKVDRDCQDYILNKLHPIFRSDGVICEEDTLTVALFDKNKDSGRKWVIDPLDGSYLHSRRKPSFGVVIGLQKDKEYVIGAMYQPKEKILYLAVRGEGLKKFTAQDTGGIEVKLHDNSVPCVGDLVLLGGWVPERDSPILNEQISGLIFRYEENLCSVDRTRKVLEGQAKAYLRYQSHIYGAGPQMFIIEQAGGIAVGLDLNLPVWEQCVDGNKKVTKLKSYAILGPRKYCTLLAPIIKKVLHA